MKRKADTDEKEHKDKNGYLVFQWVVQISL